MSEKVTVGDEWMRGPVSSASKCGLCGKPLLHGSSLPGGSPGTYLNESGCHDGVWMDDDEYHEGWASDTIYRPCPNNPKCCKRCHGSGSIYRDGGQEDCPNKTCNAGWKGEPQWPIPREPEEPAP